jgi:hypothetical protein
MYPSLPRLHDVAMSNIGNIQSKGNPERTDEGEAKK